MKKLFNKSIFVLLMCMCSILLFACGKNENEIVEGTLAFSGCDEEKMSQNLTNLLHELGEIPEEVSFKEKYFDDFNSLLLALDNNKIDQAAIQDSVLNYMQLTIEDFNDKYEVVGANGNISYAMLLKEGNESLRDDISKAIEAMQKDGTLDALKTEYVDYVSDIDLFKANEDDTAYGNELTIAVTGDLPPIDYINADGIPCGYNIAFLRELSTRLKRDIRVIETNTASKGAALETGKCDVVFWVRINQFNSDIPANGIVTTSYYEDGMKVIKKK